MFRKPFSIIILCVFYAAAYSQQKNDSTVKVDENYITLSEIVVSDKLDVPSFIERVRMTQLSIRHSAIFILQAILPLTI